MTMQFTLGAPRHSVGRPSSAYLIEDNWDDWGKYRTMYQLLVYDAKGERHEIGSLKIGQSGLEPSPAIAPGKRAPTLNPQFEVLTAAQFSLGQDDNYYEVLNELSEELRVNVLRGLRDCAYDLSVFEQFRTEEVMSESLLRSVSESQVRHRFHRLSNGDAALSNYYFEYQFSSGGGDAEPPRVTFKVTPLSEPPSNVHVLIGRNGVGKTRCLHRLAGAILSSDEDPANLGIISSVATQNELSTFAGVVVVSFSAFDLFRLPPVTREGIRASRIGMPDSPRGTVEPDPNSSRDRSFADDFRSALEKCGSGPRLKRLKAALATLENDPLFAEANVGVQLDDAVEAWIEPVVGLFNLMSSGHKIVLLTITRLVELVDERTLVLIDEPEGHLHPPLLSAFVRALSDLLIKRNGLAIISTHSPVVLQEVPRACSWILWRSGREARVARPAIETFGENVGILTREVFGLEVTTSGYHQILKTAVADPALSFDDIMAKFDGQLGAEAQVIVRTLIAIRDAPAEL